MKSGQCICCFYPNGTHSKVCIVGKDIEIERLKEQLVQVVDKLKRCQNCVHEPDCDFIGPTACSGWRAEYEV